jgi:hypothetical protein
MAAALAPSQAREVNGAALFCQPREQVRTENFVIRMSEEAQHLGHCSIERTDYGYQVDRTYRLV